MMGRAIFTVTAELPAPNDGGAADAAVPQTLLGAGEREGQVASGAHDRLRKKRLVARLAVDGQAVDVLQAVPPGCARRGDLNGLSGGERDHGAIEKRCVHGQDGGSRGARIQAKGSPDIPAGQGAEVVVARRTARCRAEQPADPVDRPLGFPRLADVVVQPGHPETGLVTGPQIGFVGADVELW